MAWNILRSGRVTARCIVEPLEERRFLSATTILESLRPLPDWPAHVQHEQALHASQEVEVQAKNKHAAKKDKPVKQAKQKKAKKKESAPLQIAPAIEPTFTGPAVQLTLAEQRLLAANKPAVKLLGTWSGTFTRNRDGGVTDGSVTFTWQQKDTATGTFDVSSIAGQEVVSTVMVGKNRVFAAMLYLNNNGQVSLAGTVTSDHETIYGRWSVETTADWSTGVFRFTFQA